MAYSVVFTKTAKHQFDKLTKPARRTLGEAIDALSTDPRPSGTVKLSGADRLYRVRSGDYRVIYQIQDRHLLILVVKVATEARSTATTRSLSDLV